jgi:hypothetical protein
MTRVLTQPLVPFADNGCAGRAELAAHVRHVRAGGLPVLRVRRAADLAQESLVGQQPAAVAHQCRGQPVRRRKCARPRWSAMRP